MREIVAPAEAIFLDAKSEAELAELYEESDAIRARRDARRHGRRGAGSGSAGPRRLRHPRPADLPDRRSPKESRAWTIRKGATAPEAAGVIHTDFQRGFIKAEIVSYDDIVAAGSMNAAKAAGKVRMEGKDYVMADGDVVEFRFNV